MLRRSQAEKEGRDRRNGVDEKRGIQCTRIRTRKGRKSCDLMELHVTSMAGDAAWGRNKQGKGRADRVGPHGSEKDEHSDLSERPREHVRTVRMATQQRGLERTETKQAKREI